MLLNGRGREREREREVGVKNEKAKFVRLDIGRLLCHETASVAFVAFSRPPKCSKQTGRTKERRETQTDRSPIGKERGSDATRSKDRKGRYK